MYAWRYGAYTRIFDLLFKYNFQGVGDGGILYDDYIF